MGWVGAVPDAVWAWGPAFFLLVGIYVLARQALKSPVFIEFVKAQREQASAMQSQANSMQQLATCIETQQKKGSLENQEIVLMLKVLRSELKDVREAVRKLTKEKEEGE